MIETVLRVRLYRQPGGLNRCDYLLSGLAAAGGRVPERMEFFGKSPEIMNRVRSSGEPHGWRRGIPVRADDHDGAGSRQSPGGGGKRRSGSAGAQCEGRRAVWYKQNRLC